MPILFSCSVSLCDKSCVLEVVSSESADWACAGEKKSHLDIACLLLLQYHCCRKQLESLRMVIEQCSCGCFFCFFFCTVIKPLCFVDISFSFRALGNPSRKSPLKSPCTWHKGWYVQIYSIYTSPGQRPVSLGICHPTQISSPIPWG